MLKPCRGDYSLQSVFFLICLKTDKMLLIFLMNWGRKHVLAMLYYLSVEAQASEEDIERAVCPALPWRITSA